MGTDTVAASSAASGTSPPELSGQKLFAKVAGAVAGAQCGRSGAAAGPSTTATSQRPTSCSYAAAAGDGTPPSGSSEGAGQLNPANVMPTNLSSDPASSSLSALRQHSSIPMADAVPQHQAPGQPVWVYPSEQMFFNAMKRKGWDPHADDMKSVVAIHNAVNERAWREVMAWEQLHCDQCPAPKLKKFRGRPNDFSPKARLLNLMGFGLPFDRHDWVVDRCGQEVRYVIDFYNGGAPPGAPPAFFLDVRPALDSFGAAYDRVRMQAKWVFSGRWITGV